MAIIATHIAATTLGGDTACLGQMLLPVRRVEPVVAHVLARRGSVDKAPLAEINADVRALLAFEVEEKKIATPQARQPDRLGGLALCVGAVRQVHAPLPIAVLDEAAAIEPRGHRGAAEMIRTTTHRGGLRRGTVGGRGAH